MDKLFDKEDLGLAGKIVIALNDSKSAREARGKILS
jgi:hypothetical protein